jgi:hypothetical protein
MTLPTADVLTRRGRQRWVFVSFTKKALARLAEQLAVQRDGEAQQRNVEWAPIKA